MKPNFALNFTEDRIDLLHRTAQGWLPLASVAMAAPDLGEQLARMRAQALDLEPGGIFTRLDLPNSQILYTNVEIQGPDGARRRGQIRRALDGRTPYALDDLAFDWSGTQPMVQVAVVARETLNEAEAFAQEHGFNPVTFAARPEPGQFAGEPDFGPTAAAESLIPPGQKLEKDARPLPVISPPSAAPVVADEPAQASVPQASLAQPSRAQPDEAQPDLALPDAPPVEVATVAEKPGDVFAASADRQPDDRGPHFEPAPDALATEPATAQPEPAPVLNAPAANPVASPVAAQPNDPTPPHSVPVDDAVAAPETSEAPEAPAVFDVPLDDDEPVFAPPLPESTLPEPTFSSRRDAGRRDGLAETSDAPTGAPTGTRRSGVLAPAAFGAEGQKTQPGMPASPPARERPPISTRSSSEVTAPGLPPLVSPKPDLVAPLRPLGKPAPGKVTDPRTKPPLKDTGKSATIARFVPMKPKGPKPPRQDDTAARVAAMSAAIAAPTKTPPPKDAMRQGLGTTAVVGGKPRYLGLILTAALVLILVAVALWATLQDDTPATAALAPATDPSASVPATDLASAAPATDVASSVADTVTAPVALAPAPAAQAALDTAEPVPQETAPVAPAAADQAAAPNGQADVAALADAAPQPEQGTAPAAEPAGPAPQASADATVLPPTAQDVDATVALPTVPLPGTGTLATSNGPPPLAQTVVAETDARPEQPVPPAPFGMFFDRDENGFVVATPEGALTPEGAIVIAGKPPVLPPVRRQAGAAVAAGELAAGELAATPELVVPAPFADPALAKFRPRQRPASLVGPQDDTLLIAEPQIATAATVRPKARPAGLAPLAATAALADPGTSLQDQAAAVSGAQPVVPASPQAVTASRRPSQRPKDFAASVATALAAVEPDAPETALVVASAAPAPRPAQPAAEPAPKPAPEPAAQPAKPAPEPEPAATAAIAESDAEPELAAVAPAIPTKASVAKQATERNVINLSKLNLIGVYGAASDRHALVRLPSGRYVRVKVGDRVDGGKIAAIGDQELRYVKDGRNMVLALPKEG